MKNKSESFPSEYLMLTKTSIRHDKSNYIIVDYRLRNTAGEVVKRSSKSFKKKSDAAAFIAELKKTHAEEMYAQENPSISMTFGELYKKYEDSRISDKVSTRINRESIVKSRILPFFQDKNIRDINMDTVAQWQRCFFTSDGTPLFKDTYLRSLHSRLSAILNYAVYCGWLDSNPAKKNSIGKKNADERPVWTLDEYKKFRSVMEDEPTHFYAFETLYFTGLRLGELLGLTIGDYNRERREIHITKSLQRLKGTDYVDSPKTEQSIRVVKLPKSLCSELDEYISSLPITTPNTRIFEATNKNKMEHALKRGISKTGLNPITIHCFRHSHITNLISQGYSPVDIAKRVGHESIYITLHYSHAFNDIEEKMTQDIDSDMEALDSGKA